MCDCYSQKCEMCDRSFPIHLADYAIERADVQVFCRKHLPKTDVVVHRVIERCYALPKGCQIGFRFKRELPEGYTFGRFCPNIDGDTEMVVNGNPVIQEVPA